MLRLTIRTYRHIGDDTSEEIELGDIIDERDISLGEAFEMVIGNMMQNVGNVGTTVQRTRVRTPEDMEVTLSHEYYIGHWPPQNEHAIPESWYSYWYSFTPQSRDIAGVDAVDLMMLYDAVIVYFQHFEKSNAYLYSSPEFRRHIERKLRGAFAA